MSSPVTKSKAQLALEELDNFDAEDFRCNLYLTASLKDLYPGKQLEKVIDQLIQNEEMRLVAQYNAALKDEMAKHEEEDWWQKV